MNTQEVSVSCLSFLRTQWAATMGTRKMVTRYETIRRSEPFKHMWTMTMQLGVIKTRYTKMYADFGRYTEIVRPHASKKLIVTKNAVSYDSNEDVFFKLTVEDISNRKVSITVRMYTHFDEVENPVWGTIDIPFLNQRFLRTKSFADTIRSIEQYIKPIYEKKQAELVERRKAKMNAAASKDDAFLRSRSVAKLLSEELEANLGDTCFISLHANGPHSTVEVVDRALRHTTVLYFQHGVGFRVSHKPLRGEHRETAFYIKDGGDDIANAVSAVREILEKEVWTKKKA